MTIGYETPYEIFIALDVSNLGEPILIPSYHRFWMVSAQATFVHGGSVSGSRGLWVFWQPPSIADITHPQVIYPSEGSALITGISTAAVAEDMTLSCSGFSPFLDKTHSPFIEGGKFSMQLQQNTGVDMTVRNVRFTLVAF